MSEGQWKKRHDAKVKKRIEEQTKIESAIQKYDKTMSKKVQLEDTEKEMTVAELTAQK